MRTIKVKDLKDGMTFTKPVYVEGENVFVPAGVPMRQKDIDRLIRWDVTELHTEGEASDPGAKAGAAGAAGTAEAKGAAGAAGPGIAARLAAAKAAAKIDLSAAKDLPGDRKTAETYVLAVEQFERIANEIASNKVPERALIDDLAVQLVDRVKENRADMVSLILSGEREDRRISSNTVNITILSILMGIVLKITGHKLIQLATGALLHDVGMLRVPREILKKKEKLSAEELNQIHTHPLHSYRIISKELKYAEDVAVVGLQHHEHWDGQGYPRHLRGEDINLFARILAVADAYMAMISDRPYRDSVIGYSAMKSVLNDNGRHFDPKILKAFIESMGIYPIGSIVQLNDSSIGRVVEVHTETPLRPVLELVVDAFGNSVTEREVVDMLQKRNLFIVKAVDPKMLAKGAPRNA